MLDRLPFICINQHSIFDSYSHADQSIHRQGQAHEKCRFQPVLKQACVFELGAKEGQVHPSSTTRLDAHTRRTLQTEILVLDLGAN